MKPARFAYHDPETIDDVVALLGNYGDEAKPLAGGQSLVPMLSLRLAQFGHLVDLRRVAVLRELDLDDDEPRIGAMVTQAAAEHDATVASAVPLLHRALPLIGHFQIRNRGTIGGSIAHADPASELPAVALALDATMDVVGGAGQRQIPAADFFETTWTTALGDDEVLAAVRFPRWSGRTGFAVDEITRRHGDFAIVGAAVGVAVDDDAITRAAIGLFGVASTPLRAAAAEAALLEAGVSAQLDEVGRIAAGDLQPTEDIHATADYRVTAAAVVVRRAVERAIREATADE